ncbi:MAG: hypothetical protein IT384_16430 [Deltaproteobacteria bacterium]|nr:hypothetical protein [Deltaproteobacteria bacterium]
MQRMKLQITSTTLTLALLTATGPVFAQEETTGTETGGETTLSETSQGGETAPPTADMAAPAGGSRLAVEFAKRPLTNGRFILVPQLDFTLAKAGAGDPGIALALGATFGVTDDLDVYATVLPLALAPAAGYGDIALGGTFRFMKGNTEVGLRVDVYLPTSTVIHLSAGVPILFHFGDKMRLDTGLMADFTTFDPFSFQLRIPLQLGFQLIPMLAAQLRTGYTLPLAPSTPGPDAMAIPLGVAAIISIPGKNNQPMLDIIPAFDWGAFLTPAGASAVNADVFTLTVTAKFYLFI